MQFVVIVAICQGLTGPCTTASSSGRRTRRNLLLFNLEMS